MAELLEKNPAAISNSSGGCPKEHAAVLVVIASSDSGLLDGLERQFVA
jgi:hypothetical protein